MLNPFVPVANSVRRFNASLAPRPCGRLPAKTPAPPSASIGPLAGSGADSRQLRSRSGAPLRRGQMVQALGASFEPNRTGADHIGRVLRPLSFAAGIVLAGCIIHLLLGWAHSSGGRGGGGDAAGDLTDVKMVSHRDGDVTQIEVENSELSEVTMTFCFSVENLKANVRFPYTATFKPGKTEAFTLKPLDPARPWEFSYTNYFKLGSADAVHDDTCVYLLPYLAGQSYRVTQGYNGKFSHTGADQYAIDWDLPEGTPVVAARGGLVVKVKDDSNRGGPSLNYDRWNNYVIIRHDDGTLGQYCHLKKGGVRVTPGQRVKAGDWIALSGNTGFSSGPHLHFCVFKAESGRKRVSIPVKFWNADDQPITPLEGHVYRAPGIASIRIAALRRRSPMAVQ
jgi:Peptidase family M23